MRKFTKQQVDFICDQIGEWYVQWRDQLVDYDNKQHRLGYAKELLKERICGEEYENLEDEFDINPKTNPWETEPDLLEFVDEDTGYHCFIKRHLELKHLCGYVALNKEHKLYGKDKEDSCFDKINVHKGLSYSGELGFWSTSNNYKKLYYVLGFDCGHAGDLVPYLYNSNPFIGGSYKDIEYVTNECKNLAKQLKELDK